MQKLTGGRVIQTIKGVRAIHVTGVVWGRGASSRRRALPAIGGRAPGGGFRPMRTAWTTWSGCAGRLASCVRVAATPGAGGSVMAGSSAPNASGNGGG